MALSGALFGALGGRRASGSGGLTGVCSVGGWVGRMAEGALGPPIAPSPSTFSSSAHRFIYELEHFNGVAELLEILGR